MTQYSFTLKSAAATLSILAMAAFAGCQTASEPANSQYTDSQAAAEVTASGIGDASGGAGTSMDDAMLLANGQAVGMADPTGKYHVQSRSESYDSTTHTHTVVFTRLKDWGNGFTYTGQWTYTYVFYDASGNAMKSYTKGTTDKLVINEKGGHMRTTPRVHVADSSNGNWTLTGIVNQSTTAPIINGVWNQAGTDTIEVGQNAGRVMTHTFQVNHTNDQLMRDALTGFVYLVGTGNSNFSATSIKGVNFTRTTQITFNADGTATLAITRTSGNGSVDTFTIDVKQGFWLR